MNGGVNTIITRGALKVVYGCVKGALPPLLLTVLVNIFSGADVVESYLTIVLGLLLLSSSKTREPKKFLMYYLEKLALSFIISIRKSMYFSLSS